MKLNVTIKYLLNISSFLGLLKICKTPYNRKKSQTHFGLKYINLLQIIIINQLQIKDRSSSFILTYRPVHFSE